MYDNSLWCAHKGRRIITCIILTSVHWVPVCAQHHPKVYGGCEKVWGSFCHQGINSPDEERRPALRESVGWEIEGLDTHHGVSILSCVCPSIPEELNSKVLQKPGPFSPHKIWYSLLYGHVVQNEIQTLALAIQNPPQFHPYLSLQLHFLSPIFSPLSLKHRGMCVYISAHTHIGTHTHTPVS